MVTNHYAVMGIQDFARGSEAKRAYHRLALVWHPDRQVNASEQRQKEAEDVFKKINEAYAILSDKVRRKEFDLDLRSELLGMAGSTSKTAGANAGPNSTDPPKRSCSGNAPDGVGTRQLMCPECGIGRAVKANKKGGPSLQCHGCSAYFHEVYCAGCKEWGATKGRRGESSMRCACGNVFCQSRCPSCRRWNTFNGEVQGGGSRSCGFCGCKFHEAFCPGCSSWGVWEGKKGCRSLSCDCTAVFYEISCQSCGMWGSVKGRHADANNSLSCGTCGSESHEAFCPSCRQWDSYAGAKGESTLVCKSARCRIRPADGSKKKTAAAAKETATSTTKFFQVYCERCACWRSVLGDKTAIGSANIRCEGCKTDICGTTCPACGNWDQLPRQQNVGTGATRVSQKKPGQDSRLDRHRAADQQDDGNGSSSRKKTHQCTSCGHEPPPSPDQGGQAAGAYSSERAHQGVGAATQAPVAVAAAATAVVSARAAASAATPKSAAVSPEVKNDKSATTTTTGGGKKPPAATDVGTVPEQGPCTRDGPPAVRRKVKDSPPSVPVTTASSAGGEAPPQAPTPAPIHGMSTKPPPRCNSPRREHVAEDAVLPAKSFTSSDTAAVRATSVQLNKGDDEGGSGSGLTDNDAGHGITDSGLEAREDGQPVPKFCLENEDALRPAAPMSSFPAQPPPRSRKKEGRRPYARRRPAPPSSSGAATRQGAGAAGAAEAAIQGTTNDGSEVVPPPSTDDGEELSGATAPHDDGGEVAYRRTGRSRRASDRNDEMQSGASRRRKSSRQRQKRLGSFPNPSAELAETTTESSTTIRMTEETAAVEKIGDAPASTKKVGGHKQEGGRSARYTSSSISSSPTSATFTAVPRESSPPPPPGIRIGKSDETEGGIDGPGTRRSEGQGQVMVHLAFCSRCQEYQSWRAPWRSGGNCWRGWKEGANGGGVRRHCTECGDLFANVSYYPVR